MVHKRKSIGEMGKLGLDTISKKGGCLIGAIDKLVRESEHLDVHTEDSQYWLETASSVFASRVLSEVKACSVYEMVVSHLPQRKVDIYLYSIIKSESRPALRDICKSNGIVKKRSEAEDICSFANMDMFRLLQMIVRGTDSGINDHARYMLTRKRLVDAYRRSRKAAAELLCRRRWWSPFEYRELTDGSAKMVVHLCEGIDNRRRSDFVWFPKSGIDAEQVLVYIDRNNVFCGATNNWFLKRRRNYAPDHVLQELRRLGLKWVFVERVLLPRKAAIARGASPRREPSWLWGVRKQCTTAMDKWLLRKVEELVRDILFWKSFHEAMNVKLLFQPEEGDQGSIAQGIAFDMLGDEGGLTVGKQRSDQHEAPGILAGHHTKDILFSWNSRIRKYLSPRYNAVRTQVITGHPNDMNFFVRDEGLRRIQERLYARGARFIIALFDSGHEFLDCRRFLVSFYRAFLTLAMEDSTMGLVIKSKKPYVIRELPEIHRLLGEAEMSGRCFRFRNEFGRLPSDASRIADIAVGAGLANSALTEAIIAGCRGCYYHYAFPREHEYYKWGYGRFVFDDLEKLIRAIKRFKSNPESVSELGDMSPFLDKLDPYRDGRAGERMGEYLRWCLEGFDLNLSRVEVLNQANKRYVAKWGGDKIREINMEGD